MLKETIYDTDELLAFINGGKKSEFKVEPFTDVYGDITAKNISLVRIETGEKHSIYTFFSENINAKENEEHLETFLTKSKLLVDGILENYFKED